MGQQVTSIADQQDLRDRCAGVPADRRPNVHVYSGFRPESSKGLYFGAWSAVRDGQPSAFRARGFGDLDQSELEVRGWLATYGARPGTRPALHRH